MAYIFSEEVLAKLKVTDDEGNEFTLNGVAGRENSADSIMGGLSIMLDIVGWSVQDAVRIVNQDIVESE